MKQYRKFDGLRYKLHARFSTKTAAKNYLKSRGFKKARVSYRLIHSKTLNRWLLYLR